MECSHRVQAQHFSTALVQVWVLQVARLVSPELNLAQPISPPVVTGLLRHLHIKWFKPSACPTTYDGSYRNNSLTKSIGGISFIHFQDLCLFTSLLFIRRQMVYLASRVHLNNMTFNKYHMFRKRDLSITLMILADISKP